MAKMIVLDPAIPIDLRADWKLLVTEAGRYAAGLTATIHLMNGTTQSIDSVPLADTEYRNAYAQLVAYRSKIPCDVTTAKLLELASAVEGAMREQADEAEAERESQATRLIKLALESDAIFLRDQLGDAYCAIMGDGQEVLKVRSKKFRLWLRRLMWEAEEKAPSGQAIEDALGHLEGKAIFEGKEIPLAVRVAWEGNTLWYDLGGKAVKVTADGWEVVLNPPILFKRFQANSPQVDPIRGGKAADFLEFVRVKNERDRLLLLGELVVSFLPDFPHAVLVLSGDQGAAKSTLQKLVKALVDPSPALTLSAPDSVREFVQQMSHHWVLFIDNLASLPQWLSDALCKAVTGDGFSKRELYSDDDDVLYAFRRVVGLNGINLVVERPDLLDRSVLIALERVPDAERREDRELWKAFDAGKPEILGGIFDTLVKAMEIHPTLTLPALPRMADFVRWGEAVTQAMGNPPMTFLEAFRGNVGTQNEVALEASPVAQALIAFMEDKASQWKGTPAELLDHLTHTAETLKLDTKSKKWPKEPSWLWRRITEVRPNLIALGIQPDRKTDNKARIIVLSRISLENGVGGDGADDGPKNQALGANSMPNDAVGCGSDAVGKRPCPHPADSPADSSADSTDSITENGVGRMPLKHLRADGTDSTDSIFLKSPTHTTSPVCEEGEV